MADGLLHLDKSLLGSPSTPRSVATSTGGESRDCSARTACRVFPALDHLPLVYVEVREAAIGTHQEPGDDNHDGVLLVPHYNLAHFHVDKRKMIKRRKNLAGLF
jgi:hypothetical protein